jgi:hypothetical protein
MRDVPESPWITTMATTALGQVEHDGARGALDLIRGFRTVAAQLCNDGAQCADQIESDFVGDQHGHVLLS